MAGEYCLCFVSELEFILPSHNALLSHMHKLISKNQIYTSLYNYGPEIHF